jgi:cytochrome bd-type quinol oxidase subunit 2
MMIAFHLAVVFLFLLLFGFGVRNVVLGRREERKKDHDAAFDRYFSAATFFAVAAIGVFVAKYVDMFVGQHP